ncbi:MAG: NUDIX hydrolase [Candidatus Nanopelagicales bacterium]
MTDLLAAATVVLVREGDTGLELLLLKRPQQGAFANAWVFPGGRVEVEDVVRDDDTEVDVARRTAARETLEETGLVVHAEDLSHFAVWLPPPQAPKRFHTWFFIGAAPMNAVVKLPDGELVEHAWMTPVEAIERHQRQEIDLMPPTFVTIQSIAEAVSIEAALELANVEETPLFESFVVQIVERPTVVWVGDEEHPNSTNANGRHRLYMGDRPWTFERNF